MRFKKLSDKDKVYIESLYKSRNENSLTVEQLAINLGNEYNVSERTVRRWFGKLGLKEKDNPEPTQYKIAKEKTYDEDKKIFMVTFAQNNTPVHKEFFNNLVKYADFHNANLHVIAGRYKNPTSVWTNKQETDEFWADEVLPYLDANRHDIHEFVSIMSDVKIQPTAVNPMTGLQGLSRVNSCVFGSPKVQMEMIPVLQGNKPKMMLTTGAVTKKNYTDSKAGKKGEFHHTFGFVIIEVKDDETFYVRQVTADDKTGDFYDLCYRVNGDGVEKIDKISGIVLGDIHAGNHDQDVLNETHKFLNKIKPKHVVLHDIFDGYSINHHEIKDPFIQYGKEVQGTNDLGEELKTMMNVLEPFEKYKEVVIVRSNHDDFFDRWLKNGDWKKQPTFKNSRIYMHCSDILLQQYAETPEKIKGVIPALINEVYPNFITLGVNDSYKIKGYEISQHGHIGPNGARGSVEAFRKLNTKIIVAHSHTPSRKDGVLVAGTSTKLRLGYNVGASSWLHSHVLIQKDGRAQHLNFVKDKNGEIGFTTFKY